MVACVYSAESGSPYMRPPEGRNGTTAPSPTANADGSAGGGGGGTSESNTDSYSEPLTPVAGVGGDGGNGVGDGGDGGGGDGGGGDSGSGYQLPLDAAMAAQLASDGAPRSWSADDGDDDGDLPETRERRMTELRLLHNYILWQTSTLDRTLEEPLYPNEARDRNTEFHWGIEMVEVAFEDEAVLHAVLAQSALCKWTRAGSDDERASWRRLQQRYLALSLRAQRRSVDVLGTANADAVAMASLMILNHSFALVQTVPTTPVWQPPAEWRMGRGTGQVIAVARGRLSLSGTDRMTRFLNSPPHFDVDDMFAAENREHLMWLLEAPAAAAASDSPEMRDPITRVYYNRILSYIGWVERAERAVPHESTVLIMRRLAAFAAWVPDVLADFLEQRRPRAMVVIAYFFALWVPYEHVWMVGRTGRNQLRAIYAEIPPEWREKLDPLMDQHGLR